MFSINKFPVFRAAICIFFVWLYSLAIAFPPLVAIEKPSNTSDTSPHDKQCRINQNLGYTIYSTVGAFYVPLIVMCVLYSKVFKATLNRRKAWVALPLPATPMGVAGRERRGTATEMLVLISATDSLRRHYPNQEKTTGAKKEKKKAIKLDKKALPKVNPHRGYKLMRNGKLISVVSDEDLALSDNNYYQDYSERCTSFCKSDVELPEIIINDQSSVCYLKVHTKPMNRQIELSQGTSELTATSDSYDLISSTTDFENNTSAMTVTDNEDTDDPYQYSSSDVNEEIKYRSPPIRRYCPTEQTPFITCTGVNGDSVPMPDIVKDNNPVRSTLSLESIDALRQFTRDINALSSDPTLGPDMNTRLHPNYLANTSSQSNSEATRVKTLNRNASVPSGLSQEQLELTATAKQEATDSAGHSITYLDGLPSQEIAIKNTLGGEKQSSISSRYYEYQMDQSSICPQFNMELSESSDVAMDTRRQSLKNQNTIQRTPDKKTKTKPRKRKITKRKNRRFMKSRKICISQEKRAAKTLGIIMGCFILCWLPFFLIVMIQPLCPGCMFPPLLIDICTWMGYLNSMINPGIYTFFNTDFKKAFVKLLTCKTCKKESHYM